METLHHIFHYLKVALTSAISPVVTSIFSVFNKGKETKAKTTSDLPTFHTNNAGNNNTTTYNLSITLNLEEINNLKQRVERLEKLNNQQKPQ